MLSVYDAESIPLHSAREGEGAAVLWHSAIRAAGEIKNKTQVRKKQTQIVWESVCLCACVVVYQCVCVLVVAIKSSTCVWTDGGIPFFTIFVPPPPLAARNSSALYSVCFIVIAFVALPPPPTRHALLSGLPEPPPAVSAFYAHLIL